MTDSARTKSENTSRIALHGMWFFMILGTGLAASSRGAGCPELLERAELISRNAQSLGAKLPVVDVCVYGRQDEDVLWLAFVHAFERESGRDLGRLPFPDPAQEGLGSWSSSQLGFVDLRPQFLDYNFDGYLDVSLLAYRGATGNSGSNIWLFDAEERSWHYEAVLSGHDFEIDSIRQELTTSWNGGHAGAIFSTSTHRWIEGELKVVRAESQDWDEDRSCYQFQRHELKGNRLVETARACGPDTRLGD